MAKKIIKKSKEEKQTANPDEQSELRKLEKINKSIEELLNKWCEIREKTECYLLINSHDSIDNTTVDIVFDKLRSKYPDGNDSLDVIVHSGGGSIDSAFNLSLLFRQYGRKKLIFIVPRWAKSAATLLVTSGDKILMSPVAELGPLDPQITELNSLEGRLESFSPLHIDATMKLIRNEYNKGNERFAEALLQRLQYPLTLGKYSSSMNIGKQYLKKLLSTRMLKGAHPDKIKKITKQMTSGFADHGYCINYSEALSLGLKVEKLNSEELDIMWDTYKLIEKKSKIQRDIKQKQLEEKIKNIPPEILKKINKLIDVNEEEDNA